MTDTQLIKIDQSLIKQQANHTIKKQVYRACVELITNSDDSYCSMERKKERISNDCIYIDFIRGKNAFLRIQDFAEGLDSNDINKNIGIYGDEISKNKIKKKKRGLWHRGLKEAIFGLGSGEILSIKNDSYYVSSIYQEKKNKKISFQYTC